MLLFHRASSCHGSKLNIDVDYSKKLYYFLMENSVLHTHILNWRERGRDRGIVAKTFEYKRKLLPPKTCLIFLDKQKGTREL